MARLSLNVAFSARSLCGATVYMAPPRAAVGDVHALSTKAMLVTVTCASSVPTKMPPPLSTARLPSHTTSLTATSLLPEM